MNRICSVLLVLSVTVLCPRAGIIPPERMIEWSSADYAPGVRGGIPERAKVFQTLPASASAEQINNALRICPSNSVVELSAGVFNLDAKIILPNFVTLRGQGTNTILKGVAGFGAKFHELVQIGNKDNDYDYSFNKGQPLHAGYTKGSTNLSTPAPHGWRSGDCVLIDEMGDPRGDPPVSSTGTSGTCTWCARENGARPVGQWIEVLSVTDGTNLTFRPPLHWNYHAARKPEGYKIPIVRDLAGVEQLRIDNSVSAASDPVSFGWARNCWLKRVDVRGSVRRSVDVFGALWCEFRDCVFAEGVPATPVVSVAYGPGRAYGIFLSQATTASWIENCIFEKLSLGVSMEGATSGNVISYNYFGVIYFGDAVSGRDTIAWHGSHDKMNLVEGNYCSDKIMADDYWGTSSHNTLFRNRIFNQLGKSQMRWGLDLWNRQTYYNVVGNVFGTPGVENIYDLRKSYSSEVSIYRLGRPDAGRDVVNEQVVKTLLRHGNFDTVAKGARWDPTIADRVLPASLVHAAKPSWWPSVSQVPWPPIGPDLGGATNYHRIPAHLIHDGVPLVRDVAAPR